MLVLTRRRDEAIIIDHDGQRIRILIGDVSGKKVRIGIEAPESTRIWREELPESQDAPDHK